VVSIANSEQKAAIEKQYFPTLSASVLPEIIAEVLESVKLKLPQKRKEKLCRRQNESILFQICNSFILVTNLKQNYAQ